MYCCQNNRFENSNLQAVSQLRRLTPAVSLAVKFYQLLLSLEDLAVECMELGMMPLIFQENLTGIGWGSC